MMHRRQILVGLGAVGLTRASRWATGSTLQLPFSRATVSVAHFGAPPGFAGDATRAIQAAINFVERNGGGTVLIPGRYRCGSVEVSGANVRLQGRGGWLVDGRLTIRASASNVVVADLGLLDTRGDRRSYLMVVSGRNCSFTNVSLVKDPPTGGYQMYVNPPAAGCHFDGLRLLGSNGIMLAGRDHLFENFEFQAMMQKSAGGDDAFAIKGDGCVTENIAIRNGVVRGYAAIVSFGSEIGRRGGKGPPGAVRNVTVENVIADRCTHLTFFKPGAIAYDWRDGLVENVVLRNLTLNDPTGEYFRTGIEIRAGRGAIIRNIQVNGITIIARAMDRGIAPTAAVYIETMDLGAPATIRDVNLQLIFTDPYSGAAHGSRHPGYPVDYVANVQKRSWQSGLVAGIKLDIRARGSGKGGIVVGRGLDGAVDISKAELTRVAASPPQGSNGAGIWSDSRVHLGDIAIDSVKRPKFGGSAFAKRLPASTRR